MHGMQATFFWHDYETTGADPRRDRPSQFAGIRTTLALEPLGEPVIAYCKPARDTLPQPDAVLLTGITPQHAEREGLPEAGFAALVHEQLALPGTCGAGYNSVRFDDEVTRNLLYRNFHDPYAREWQHGNSRWDLIDLARMCYAFRPEGIEWPMREPGAASFRLADLAAANGLVHGQAHDALSDVEATLSLARLLRARQPRLFEWSFALRDKRRALALLDWTARQPLLHVSSRYPATRGCVAMVMPLAALPDQPNAVIVYDLDCDPSDLLALDVEAVRDRVFTAREDLPEDAPRIPLKLVRANRCPALAPLGVLQGTNVRRIGLDVERCLGHAQRLQADPDVASKVRAVFERPATERSPEDADLALYGGFLADADRALAVRVRGCTGLELVTGGVRFADPRCQELLFRYRARNWPDTLDAQEAERWRRLRSTRLQRDDGTVSIVLDRYRERIAELRAVHASPGREQILLDALDAWGEELAASL